MWNENLKRKSQALSPVLCILERYTGRHMVTCAETNRL